jgi:hypothetical protein
LAHTICLTALITVNTLKVAWAGRYAQGWSAVLGSNVCSTGSCCVSYSIMNFYYLLPPIFISLSLPSSHLFYLFLFLLFFYYYPFLRLDVFLTLLLLSVSRTFWSIIICLNLPCYFITNSRSLVIRKNRPAGTLRLSPLCSPALLPQCRNFSCYFKCNYGLEVFAY